MCDLEPGEAGINAAKVRRFRARICQQQHWQPQHADQLTLDEAADLLQGIQRVTPDELQRDGQDHAHHGLATLDQIGLGGGEVVQVTGLSCKVIAGTTPTACPDANPVLPPSLLPSAERAIRRLFPLPAGTTIHWVGHDTGIRSRCRCHPNAPFAAPFDRGRWASVVRSEPPSPSSTPEGSKPTESDLGVDTPQSAHIPPSQPAETAPQPITVGDIRDLLVYQRKLADHLERLKHLNPTEVLAASWFPSAMPMRRAEHIAALTPPTPPRLTEDAAWSLPTYRRIAEAAGGGAATTAGRERPHVAGRCGRRADRDGGGSGHAANRAGFRADDTICATGPARP